MDQNLPLTWKTSTRSHGPLSIEQTHDIDGARLLHRIIAGSYERRSIASATNIGSGKWGTVFADDKLAAAIIDRIVHHGRLLEFTGQSHRVSEALMFGRTSAGPASEPKEKTKEQAGTLLG